MGFDLVPGIERDHPAAVRLAFEYDWTQTLLYVVRGAVHGELVFVRAGAKPRRAGALPHSAGSRWGRFATERTGNFERHIFDRKARHGFRGLWHRGGCGSD